MLRDLILKNRSYRRFHQEVKIGEEEVRGWIDLARHGASARNAQPLKYLISVDEKQNALIFPQLAWAGYLTEWPGPEEGERPSAYVVVLRDLGIPGNHLCDDGIAVQNILLGATEMGFGGCILHAVNRPALREALSLPGSLEILLVIALGKPKEQVVLEPLTGDDFRYWRDEQGVHHVPKRSLEEIILRVPIPD
ncbi:MAG: nitroreductase family protein [Marinilabiliales bacterium]|nr:nitroreductase family protein [Marinilabiliales bacterium]